MQVPIAGGFDHTERNELYPADTRGLVSVVFMLDERLRRCANTKSALTQCACHAG